MLSDIEHRQGCPATGGYGHGVEPCICGADPDIEHELSEVPASLLLGFRDMDADEIEEAVRAYARGNVEKSLKSRDKESRWATIDSVPRDGTRVLLTIEGVDRAVLGYWDGASFATIDGHDWEGRAITHWQALPPPHLKQD